MKLTSSAYVVNCISLYFLYILRLYQVVKINNLIIKQLHIAHIFNIHNYPVINSESANYERLLQLKI
jgi:hypothetical protein